MNDRHPCPSKEALVSALYDETRPEEREALALHVSECETCRDEVDALGEVRAALQAWHAPALGAHVRLVTDPPDAPHAAAPASVVPGPAPWFTSRAWRTAALAAAATLVVGVAAGLARLEITVGQGGLTVRTGWPSAVGTAEPAAALQAPQPRTASPVPVGVAGGAADAVDTDIAAWRDELRALEGRLREEFAARVTQASGPRQDLAVSRSDEEALLRRVQQMIDEAEARQQRNLALRITELAHDFDLQRKTDLVQISQGLGQLEGRAQAEAARTQELMNYIVRISSARQPR